MAESYDIQLTDPLSAAFKVKAFTSNGPIFPTSPTLNSTAVSAETSLLVYGKGHPEYGERINEDILHLLENFSGSTEPQYPISGQLWFKRYTIIRNTIGDFYLWDDTTSAWNQIIPSLVFLPITDASINDGDYWFDGATLSIAVKTPSHPLSPTWLPRLVENRNIVGVPTSASLPKKELVVYNGVEWRNVNSMPVSETEPTAPQIGDLWYDSVVPQLKIYDGLAFVSIADRYLTLSGGIMTGAIDMGTNSVINVTNPINPQDVATKSYVDGFIGGVPSALTDLTDITVAAPVANQFLKYDGVSQWNNTVLDLPHFGVTSTAAQLNFLNTSTANIQVQLDNKLTLTAGPTEPVTGQLVLTAGLNMSSTSITNILMDGSGTGATTKDYVDAAVSSPVLALNDLTDVLLTAPTPGQLIEFDGVNWVNSNYVHTHVSTDITHVSNQSMIRDLLPVSYPNVLLSDIIETTVGNFATRLDRLDGFARREVFTATAGQTIFDFTEGKYIVGSNRLGVFKDGLKQYANERARQKISFNIGKNLSRSSLVGFTAPGVYDLDVAVDGGASTVIVFNLDQTSTINDIIIQLNNALLVSNVPIAVGIWSNEEEAIYIFSSTTGTGSSIDIVEGSGIGAAVDGGLLTGLSNVVVGGNPELPVLTYVINETINPLFPSNVTSIIADLHYAEVKTEYTPGTQEVDVGGAKIITDPTGLANDATVYTATIDVDGTGAQPISITGSLAQDYATLLNEINLDLTNAYAFLQNGNIIITSDSTGVGSTILISDTNLFSTLTGFVAINPAIPGAAVIVNANINDQSTTIQFNAGLVGGEVMEMTSESVSVLVS